MQRGSDGSVSLSDSVLVNVSGADEDNEKEVLVSWSLQVRNPAIGMHFTPVTHYAAHRVGTLIVDGHCLSVCLSVCLSRA